MTNPTNLCQLNYSSNGSPIRAYNVHLSSQAFNWSILNALRRVDSVHPFSHVSSRSLIRSVSFKSALVANRHSYRHHLHPLATECQSAWSNRVLIRTLHQPCRMNIFPSPCPKTSPIYHTFTLSVFHDRPILVKPKHLYRSGHGHVRPISPWSVACPFRLRICFERKTFNPNGFSSVH